MPPTARPFPARTSTKAPASAPWTCASASPTRRRPSSSIGRRTWALSAARRTSRSGLPELQRKIGPVGDDAFDPRVLHVALHRPLSVDRPDPDRETHARMAGELVLVDGDEIYRAHPHPRKPFLDRAHRLCEIRRDDDFVGRQPREHRCQQLRLEAGLLEVEMQAGVTVDVGEDLVERRVTIAWSRLVMGEDDLAARVAPDVDLDEVGA